MAKGKCQSCGMPMKKDVQGGGSEKDGSKNPRFCSHCYMNGEFTHPGIPVEEMQARVRGRMKEMKVPGFLAELLVRGIPRLDRWRERRE